MRWEQGRRSENVEDRRRSGTKMMVGGGVGTLVIIILGLIFGVDPSALFSKASLYPPRPKVASR